MSTDSRVPSWMEADAVASNQMFLLSGRGLLTRFE